MAFLRKSFWSMFHSLQLFPAIWKRCTQDGKDSKTPIFVDASAKVFDVLLEVARGRKREYAANLHRLADCRYTLLNWW